MYDKLNAIISESGIWNGERRKSHSFLLSPSVFEVTEIQKQELQELGFALYDCMLGFSHIATIVFDPTLNYRNAWGLARRVFSTGVPITYLALQGMNIRHIPGLLKVDMMVDEKGNFRIAEIDGHNKHGLGYSTLAKRFCEAVRPEAKKLPGTVNLLAGEIKRLGYGELKLFYSDQERFYFPEFEIVKQELKRHGVNCIVMQEENADSSFASEGLFLDLPFLFNKAELYETIIPAYVNGKVRFVIPPKPFLGAKGVLALIRNDGKDEELESLLRSFIRKSSLEFVRRYIPETLLVGKMASGSDSIEARISKKKYVLKESVSSGMKGTVFSDGRDFGTVLSRARLSNMNWILQEEVVNQPQSFSWYENGRAEPILKTSKDWFMRVTVQYVNRQLADIIITARRDKAVHGAKDCLQIGTVVL